MKKRCLRYLGVGSLVLLVLLAILWPVFFNRTRGEVEAYKEQLRARGEKLEISELIPPPVPPEQNGADLFLAAARLAPTDGLLSSNPPPAMRMMAPGKALIGWAQPDVRGEMTNTWEELIGELGLHRTYLALVTQAAERPKLDFDSKYKEGFALLLPQLSKSKKAAQTLSAASLCNLHNDDINAATGNIRAGLGLVQGLEGERLMISQLVRQAIEQIAYADTWELLQSPHLDEHHLALLQKSWESFEFIDAAGRAIEMERAMVIDTVKRMQSSRAEFERMTGSFGTSGGGASSLEDWFGTAGTFMKDGWEKTRYESATFMWRTSWSYSDQVLALKGEQVLLETMRFAQTNRYFQPALISQSNKLAALGFDMLSNDDEFFFGGRMSRLKHLASQNVLALSRLSDRVIRAEAARRMAIAAIALHRYRLKHGNYPAVLPDLAPEFVTVIPTDPMDGLPLRYRLNTDGTFQLYSIGVDGKDDNGDAQRDDPSKSPIWALGHDWVWPQPATAAEIAEYYRKESLKRN